MKYKVGDEVLVKAKINDVCEGDMHPYEIKAVDNKICGADARTIVVSENDIIPVPDMTAEEAWEARKEIKVGDIVRPKTTKEREYLVTYISESMKLAGVCLQTGEVIPEAFEVSVDSVFKTGRHVNVDEILKQIGGDE